MIRTRDENQIISQVGFVLRAYPIFWFVKNLIQDPKNQSNFGKIQNIVFRTDLQRPYLESGIVGSIWKKDRNIAGSGALSEHSIHDIDILRYWFGDINKVFASIKYFTDNTFIEDSVAIIFDLKNGATAQLTSIWHNIERDARNIEIFFENAYINLTFISHKGKLTLQVKGEQEQVYSFDTLDEKFREAIGFPDLFASSSQGYVYEVLLFLNHVIEKEAAKLNSIIPDLEEGRKAHEIIEACYKSSKEKTIITI